MDSCLHPHEEYWTWDTAESTQKRSEGDNYLLLTYVLHGAESFLRSWLVLQLIKKFSAFYGTPKFITVLTSARHLSLSLANSILSPQPLPTSWRNTHGSSKPTQQRIWNLHTAGSYSLLSECSLGIQLLFSLFLLALYLLWDNFLMSEMTSIHVNYMKTPCQP